MAEVPISGLGPLVLAPDTADLLAVVDVSDTTQAPTGSTKKMTVGNLFSAPTFTGTVTLANLVVTGTSNLQGPVTLNSTLNVAGATTLAGALNINGGATFTGTGTLTVLFNTTTGAVGDVIQLVLQRASVNKWRFGMNPGGLNSDSFDIYNESLGNALVIAKATNASTFSGRVNVNINLAGDNPLNVYNANPAGYGAVVSAGAGANYSLRVERYTGTMLFQVIENGSTLATMLTVGGLITANAGIQFPSAGSFLAGSVFRSATSGLSIACVGGSVYDFAMPNVAGSLNVMAVPTGTVNVRFGGEITPGQLSAFSPAVIGTYGPYGLTVQGKTGGSSDFALLTASASGLVMYNPTGTVNMVFSGAVNVAGPLTIPNTSQLIASYVGSTSTSELFQIRQGATAVLSFAANTFTATLIGILNLPAYNAVGGLVSAGAADSGGVGFRVLRVAN